MTSSDPDQSGHSHSAESATGDSAHSRSETITRQRQSIRKTLHSRRHALSAIDVSSHSQRIARRIEPLLSGARHIAGYLAMGNEVSIDDLLASCRQRNGCTFVPLIQPDHSLLFTPLDEHTPIVQNRYGIREPQYDPEACISAENLDVVLVPLLGFDRQCNRMGMGGGYYDRTFASRRETAIERCAPALPLLIGIAHDCQCVDSVLPEWWDVPLDHVVTESQIYHRPPSAQEQ